MSAADEARINAMATARAVKAVRLYIAVANGRSTPPTPDDIDTLTAALKHRAVERSGVKVASEGTWKVVRAVAVAFGHLRTDEPYEALHVAPEGRDGLFGEAPTPTGGGR